MIKFHLIALSAMIGLLSSGCIVAKTTGKAVTLPVKGVYYTGKYAAKGVIGTAKIAGDTVIGTGKVAGKGVYKTGETVVNVTNGALDTSSKVLRVTTQVVDLSGKVVTLTKEIPASELDATIAAAKSSANVIEIFIDRAS